MDKSISIKNRLTVQSLANVAVGLIIISAPFTDIFIINKQFPLIIYGAYIVAFSILLIIFYDNLLYDKTILLYDQVYLFVLFLLLVIIAISFLNGSQTEHSLQYTLWFFWIIGMYGVVGKVMIDFSSIDLEKTYFLEMTILFACSIGLYEWAVQNAYFSGPLILDKMIRREDEFNSELMNHIRLRSTVEEAAHFGLFLNAFVPLALLRKKTNGIWFFGFGVVMIAYILTASIATWGFAILSTVMALLLIPKKKLKESILGWLAILIIMVMAFVVLTIDNQLTQRIWERQEDASYSHRMLIYTTVLERMKDADVWNWLVGYGPASFIDSIGNNPISWYLLFLHDLGITALFCSLSLGYYAIHMIRRSSCTMKQKILLMISILSLLLHYTITANFWHPWLWIVFPLIFNFIRLNENQKINGLRSATLDSYEWR